MIVNHNSIDLTLHSRSSPSDLRAFKESSTNQDNIGMLKSEELDKRNSNIASIYTKIETNEQKHAPEKSVSSLLMPSVSQTVNSSNKSLNEPYTTPLPPLFNRPLLSNNKDGVINSMNIPPTFPSLSLLPYHISANYLNDKKVELGPQMKIMELERARERNLLGPGNASISTTETSTTFSLNKSMENKSTSETSNLENKQHESTKLDNPLSFGMARLLGDVQKKIVSDAEEAKQSTGSLNVSQSLSQSMPNWMSDSTRNGSPLTLPTLNCSSKPNSSSPISTIRPLPIFAASLLNSSSMNSNSNPGSILSLPPNPPPIRPIPTSQLTTALHQQLLPNSYLHGVYTQQVMLGMRPDIFPGGTPPGFPHPLGFPHHHPHLAPHHPHLGVGLGVGHGKRKKSWTRAVFSHLQRKGLEKRFTIQKYITKPDRRLLAASLGLTDAQVKVWFQNRRMKWRHMESKQRREQERASAAAAASTRSSTCLSAPNSISCDQKTSGISPTTKSVSNISNPSLISKPNAIPHLGIPVWPHQPYSLATNDIQNESSDDDDDIDEEDFDNMDISRSPDSSDSEEEKQECLSPVKAATMPTINAPDSTGEPTADNSSDEIKVD